MKVLAVDQVSKSFNGFYALKDVSLSVSEGDRRAIIGPNGAGKSTLFNIIGGQAFPTSGRVALRGADVTKELPHQRWGRGLARTFQRNQLFTGLTVRENISLAVYRSLNIGDKLFSRADRRSEVGEAIDAGLERVNLLDRQHATGGDLAYGEQRQLELALSLVGNPTILLLDEPTAGMSPAETGAMIDVLKVLPKTITLLIVEHDMDVVFALAERVTVLHLGEILTEGTPHEIQADRKVASVYLGQNLDEAVNPLLAIEDIHTFYGESHALQGVSFVVRPGEVVGLLGRNGVGKTTTLQSILGLPIPRSGFVRFRGELISGLPTHAIVRAGISWVPQGHRIFPTLTTIENLSLAAAHSRPGYWNLKRVLELFPRLAERRAAFGGTLSGGEQQMLAIGRALIQNPDMVLMDEPTEGLSPKIVEEVASVIKLLRQRGCAIFLVEQNLTFALRVTDSIMVMNKGRIVFTGKPHELADNENLCRRYVGVGASVSVADVSKSLGASASH